MYELSRVRLHSVGPRTARYADVVLDFRGVGRPVAREQAALFGDGDGAPQRRPSPASVLFLENGGGKSVLIKLIFSVMLPGRRQVVGTTNTRVMENFVAAGEPAHVALEWQHTRTGELRVTGKVSEWRGHTVSSDPANLRDRWYSFRPTGTLSLDTLPLTESGRLRTMTGFHDQLREAHRQDPSLELGWEEIQTAWTAHLADIGLDTELFRYQRAMNSGEGEAADVFSFRTDEAFVDFLLSAVTDEQDPRGLAEVVDGYAHKLADRGRLAVEREFVSGALERLEPLEVAEQQAETARRTASTARDEAIGFLSAVARRHEAETHRAAELRAQQAAAERAEQAADHERRRLNEVILELRRLVTELRVRAAQAEAEKLDQELGEAQAALAAWRATGVVLEYRAAVAGAASLRELVAEREDRARPALAAREAALQALGRGLLATVEHADAATGAAQQRAGEHTQHAEECGAQRDGALREEASQQSRAEAAGHQLDHIRGAVDAATAEGALAEGADVAAAAERAQEAAAEATRCREAALTELARLGGAAANADHVAEQARLARTDAGEAARTAAANAESALATADELTGAERLLALLGAESIELDTDAPRLATLLGDAVAEADQRRTELSIDDRRDRKALAALGRGGLLPDPPDIAGALSVLAETGIPAWSGWRYLSRKNRDEQATVLRCYPHLVDGVVVNNAEHLSRAREALEEAALMPTSVVAVGATAAMDTPAGEPAGLEFVVSPNPAMYDEQAAEAERLEIQRRVEHRAAELAELATRKAADEELARRLAAWQRDYPPGTLAELAATRDRTAGQLATADDSLGAAVEARESAREAERAHRENLPSVTDREHEAAAHARRLGQLAKQVAESSMWDAERRAAGAQAESARDRAEQAREAARAARDAAREREREADGHRRTAEDCRAELGGLRGISTVDEAVPVPSASLDELRAARWDAENAYTKVQVEAELRTELTSAEYRESQARASYERESEAARERAGHLLSTPDGAGPAAREAATARAERAVAECGERRRAAEREVARWETKLADMAKQNRPVDDYGHPESIEHGERLIERAELDWGVALDAYEKARSRHADLQAETAERDRLVEGYGNVMESIGDIEPAPAERFPEPFGGDLEAAKATRARVRGDLTEAQRLLEAEEDTVRGRADALATYAAGERFEAAKSPVRRQILATSRDGLPRYSGQWAAALRPRLRMLTDELEQLEKHRAGIVERLKGMVRRALATLRAAQRLSRLPEGLGDWSGQEFLRITFTPPDDSVLESKLGELVDSSVEPDAARTAPRDGMSLLLRGVRAAAPRGFRADMLKPDAVLRTERLRVCEVHDVFSGGQQLTAAIVLYCTMAALRGNERGYARRAHSGVLFLDNPIGRASAGYLLDIQLAVATALGVQLVYTTGLFDAGALAVFPLLVRLRNDADLREGRKYLSVAGAEAAQLPQPGGSDDPDGAARIQATRVFRRVETAE